MCLWCVGAVVSSKVYDMPDAVIYKSKVYDAPDVVNYKCRMYDMHDIANSKVYDIPNIADSEVYVVNSEVYDMPYIVSYTVYDLPDIVNCKVYDMPDFDSCKMCDMSDVVSHKVYDLPVVFQDCGLQLTDEPDKRCYPLGDRLLCHTCHIACLSSQYPDQTFYVDPTTRNIQNAARDPRHSLSLPATAPSSYTAVSMHSFGGPPVMMSGSGGGHSNGDVTSSGGMGFSRPKQHTHPGSGSNQHTHLGSHSNQHGHFGSSSHAHPGSPYGNGGMGIQNGSYPPSPAPPPYASQHMSPTGGGIGGNGYSPGPPPPRPSSAKPATYTITDL